ncbi:glycosyltransferase [Roseibium salinum]|nr:glycosyltransferase [Roseibium salinum]
MPTQYALHDLFVWPAIREAFGLVLLEAQAAGVGVVAGGYVRRARYRQERGNRPTLPGRRCGCLRGKSGPGHRGSCAGRPAGPCGARAYRREPHACGRRAKA